MGYQHDVFISYRNFPKCVDWISSYFYDNFKFYLSQSLGGRDVNIYFDKRNVDKGKIWDLELKQALAKSKCLVPLLIPGYFHSEWCKKELAIIHNRQVKSNFTNIAQTQSLIIPITLHDGECFPDVIEKIQQDPFHDYFTDCGDFKNSQDYRKLEKRIEIFASHVATAVDLAPEYNDLWMTEEYLNIEITNFDGKPVKPRIPRQQ